MIRENIFISVRGLSLVGTALSLLKTMLPNQTPGLYYLTENSYMVVK